MDELLCFKLKLVLFQAYWQLKVASKEKSKDYLAIQFTGGAASHWSGNSLKRQLAEAASHRTLIKMLNSWNGLFTEKTASHRLVQLTESTIKHAEFH
jgi:hypothetical protein